jgi:cation:H+ antiporter
MLDFIFDAAPWAALPLLVAGFYPLVKGADFLVDGGSAIAKRLNIPVLVIGLTIVAFGTSMPELVVNLFASTGGTPDIAFGNILGSNIFNIAAILGISALIYPVAVKSSTALAEIPFVLLSALILIFMGLDRAIDGSTANVLSRSDGLSLLGFFAIFMGYVFYMAKKGDFEEDFEIKPWGLGKSLAFVALGIALLAIGGKVIVDSAVEAATNLGISERIIGLTVVAIGTSLPELATSIVAARKKNSDIAVGNVVGSNIFNSFMILGASASLTPIPLARGGEVDLFANLGISAILMLLVLASRKRVLGRPVGALFIALYVGYTAYLMLG